ncbi:Pol polyprotein [Plakobranchus ocellatus]|uniref:Pol polyprotein n=1 Tax=Plakobranchus ocellatus TaxID=259542 RepID=A0AAV4CJG7_9GAST|nr:Pol polyprotein [Plakobranchus ocellatus]
MTYLFTIIDRFTRRPEVVPLPDAHASTCATALLHHWVARFGLPEDITSDRGRQFTSSLWTQLNNLLGVEANTITAYHPQANGMVERLHRQLKTSLKARTTSPNWFAELPMVFLGIHSSWRVDPGCSPAELVYGSTLRIPADFVYVRRDSHKHPLQRPYDGPYRVLNKNDKYITVEVKGRSEVITLDRLKAAFVTHLTTCEDNTPAPVEPPVTTPSGARPETVPPAPSVLPSGGNPGPSTSTRSGRILRRPSRFHQ